MVLLMNFWKYKAFSLAFIYILFFSVSANGQLDVKHFIPPLHARALAGNHYLVLGTPVASTFNVTVKDGAGNLLATIPISNTSSSTTLIGSNYTSPLMVSQATLNTVLGNGKGLILTAPQPFYANVRVTVTDQAGSLTSKGATAAKGKEFRTGHMFNNSASGSYKSNFFSFMATEDSTTVIISDIHAGVVLEGVAPGTSTVTVILNTGQSYVVSNYVDNASASNNVNGLNGTKITSDKDIVVNCGTWLGGNAISGTSPTGASDSGKDIGIDQIVPVNNVGKEYVLIKGFGIDNERTIVVAAENNTQIFLNGSGNAVATINAGQYHVIYGTSFSTNNNLYLTASKPVFVTQTINGLSGYSVDNEHCGGMNFIPPVLCTGDKNVTIPNVQFIGSAYIQIIADAGAVIQANGNTIGGAKSIPGTSAYVTYSISGYTGDVQLTSTEPIRVALINGSGNVGAAGYFSGFSKEINMSATYESNGVSGVNEIVEGCGVATVTIERLGYFAANSAVLTLQVSGTATEGVDFSNIPTQLVLAAGQTQVSFTINAFSDNLLEGNESVILSLIINGNYCGETDLVFTIKNIAKLIVDLDSIRMLCPGDSTILKPTISGGYQPYSYLWSTGDTSSQITVGPAFTTSYGLMVTDFCALDTVYKSIIVQVPDLALSVNAGPDTTVLCPYTPLNATASVIGGTEQYSYQWLSNGIILSSQPELSYSPAVSNEYVINVVDFCGQKVSDTFDVIVTTPLMELTVNEDRRICPYDPAELWVNVTGGLQPFAYYWDHSGETSTNVWVNPGVSTTYLVRVTDACNTYEVTANPKVIVEKPLADFSILSNTQVNNLPIYFNNTSIGGVYWQWDLGNGETSTLFSPGTTYLEDGTYTVTLIATNELGCTDTVTKGILIKPEFWFYAPNAFTPDGNQFNNNYSVSVIGSTSFEFNIYNRWGELVFRAEDPAFEWDGTYDGQVIQDGVVTYTALIAGEDGETRKYVGHINVLR